MADYESDHMRVFTELKAIDKVTPEIQADYMKFIETARQLCHRKKEKFSIKLVLDELPNNKWYRLYCEYKGIAFLGPVEH